jgi:hypothetical protein
LAPSDKVSVFAAIDNAPALRASVPPTVTLPHIVAALLRVRLFNVTAGMLAAPAPPMIRFDVAPPTRVPQLAGPFSVSVFAPMDRPPPPGVNVPLTVGELCRATMLVLDIVRLFKAATLVGINTPAEVPPKTRLDEDVVARLAGVPAMVGPFNVSVLLLTVNVPAVRVSVPATVKSAPNVIFRLVLKLFNPPDIAFNVIPVPVPIVRFEAAPPVRVPPP